MHCLIKIKHIANLSLSHLFAAMTAGFSDVRWLKLTPPDSIKLNKLLSQFLVLKVKYDHITKNALLILSLTHKKTHIHINKTTNTG